MYVVSFMQANTAAVRKVAKEEVKSDIRKKLQQKEETGRRNEQKVCKLISG